MKTLMTSLALVLAATTTGAALTSAAIAGPTFTGLEGNTAVSGYDVVSYFEGNGQPVRGSDKFKVSYKGANYFFASAANATKFKQNPTAFAPQYGGHCAWAMSRGSLAPGDPLLYKVVDGKLYLNFNKNVQQTWLKDVPGFIAKADAQWPSIPDNAKFGG
ncbi:MAG: YHS domain-containing (seleno)protein [Pseudomonadota bacterium]